MKFQAICISAAVTVAMFTGLTLSHQESAQAQLLPGVTVCTGGLVLVNGVCVSVNNTTGVPTPALLPGLIGLGASLLRKRKAKNAEVTEVDI
ncbi:PTPA-CTERM sorting domain-containing protein [Mastigocladopsis repens]|uniref:PTPA-CTERM sorting domain-containing protein n=1 Tax=Mastigocladopsis repens TaxID=221287 RepID=UPI0002E85D87|nr:PTPA-CTERM sorting domain-containing protein [Mastigocladopsis repens]